jgi:PA14 domain.
VGAPNRCFALVYRSHVYLPQSGGYTFRMWTAEDGIRIYLNGTLVYDGWTRSQWGTAVTVSLESGWYNLTVKYRQFFQTPSCWSSPCLTAR